MGHPFSGDGFSPSVDRPTDTEESDLEGGAPLYRCHKCRKIVPQSEVCWGMCEKCVCAEEARSDSLRDDRLEGRR